jgi:starvation-inducible DNA-binding protein
MATSKTKSRSSNGQAPSQTEVQMGIETRDKKSIAQGLCRVLADTYTLYLKTHKFHWNVQGPLFSSLHLLFEQQYTEMAAAVDEIAERIRTLGVLAPGSYREFQSLTSIQEEDHNPTAHEMVRLLAEGHETVAATIRDMFDIPADLGDEPTVDMLTGRLVVHEKAAWMLRSILAT